MESELLIGSKTQDFFLLLMEGFVGVGSVVDGIVREVMANFLAGLQFKLLSMFGLGRVLIFVELFGLGS